MYFQLSSRFIQYFLDRFNILCIYTSFFTYFYFFYYSRHFLDRSNFFWICQMFFYYIPTYNTDCPSNHFVLSIIFLIHLTLFVSIQISLDTSNIFSHIMLNFSVPKSMYPKFYDNYKLFWVYPILSKFIQYFLNLRNCFRIYPTFFEYFKHFMEI